MAIRKTPSKKVVPAAPAATATTPVRNSAIPPKATVAKKMAPTYDQIAVRAYEIWTSGKGGSEQENWARAEQELRGV